MQTIMTTMIFLVIQEPVHLSAYYGAFVLQAMAVKCIKLH